MQKLNNLPINISQSSDFKDESSRGSVNSKANNGDRFSKLIDKHVRDDVNSLNKPSQNNSLKQRTDDQDRHASLTSKQSAKPGDNSVASGKKGQETAVENESAEQIAVSDQDESRKIASSKDNASSKNNNEKLDYPTEQALSEQALAEQKLNMTEPKAEASASQQLLSFLYAADKTLVNDEKLTTDSKEVAQAKASLIRKDGDLSGDEALLTEKGKEKAAAKATVPSFDNVLNKTQAASTANAELSQKMANMTAKASDDVTAGVTGEVAKELINQTKVPVNLQANYQAVKQTNEQNIVSNTEQLNAELTDAELATKLASQTANSSEQHSNNQTNILLNKDKGQAIADISQRTLPENKEKTSAVSSNTALDDKLIAENDIKMAEQQSALLAQEQLKALSKQNASANNLQSKNAEQIKSSTVVDPQSMSALLNKNITEDQNELVGQSLEEQSESSVSQQAVSQQSLNQQELNKQTLSQQQKAQLAQELLVKSKQNVDQSSDQNAKLSVEDDASTDLADTISTLADFTDVPLKDAVPKGSEEQTKINKNAFGSQSFTDVVGLATQANQVSEHALSQQSVEALNLFESFDD